MKRAIMLVVAVLACAAEDGHFALAGETPLRERASILPGAVAEDAEGEIVLREVAAALDAPIGVTHAGDGSGRLYIVLQRGRIVVHDGSRTLPEPFLDIRPLVSCCGERGLLGVAFHPQYPANGHFFVNYTDTSGHTVVVRYSRSALNPEVADPGSARVVLRIEQPFGNHNGGQLQFGPDGYLYVGMGDGGSGGDPGNRGQDLGTLLGKILRIDVDGSDTYTVPADNPFRGLPGVRGEIWAYGLRNPWRFTFDRQTGDLFIADVGQNRYEEVNFTLATSHGGENYGWRVMEALHCFSPQTNCRTEGLVMPILEYGRAEGCSVTGGYRYRGTGARFLQGVYFYADYCSGRIWGATQDATGQWSSREMLDTPYNITSFGEDESGELYVVDHGGRLFLITRAPLRRRPARPGPPG